MPTNHQAAKLARVDQLAEMLLHLFDVSIDRDDEHKRYSDAVKERLFGTDGGN